MIPVMYRSYVFVEYSSEAVFLLWDKDGEFLTVSATESVMTNGARRSKKPCCMANSKRPRAYV